MHTSLVKFLWPMSRNVHAKRYCEQTMVQCQKRHRQASLIRDNNSAKDIARRVHRLSGAQKLNGAHTREV
jgi:hypothetical protein